MEMGERLRTGSVTPVEVVGAGSTAAVAKSCNDLKGVSRLTAEDLLETTLHSEKDDRTNLPLKAVEETKRLRGGEATL